MNSPRNIKPEEIALLHLLLDKLAIGIENHPLPQQVDPYEGDKMGSIGLQLAPQEYAGDLIQVEYIDSDQTPVVITLTQDVHGQLLDLDFWKTDMSKLLQYPRPDQIIFR
ncbi:hypothetical protein CLV98_102288 [Dyadobacter jejuensis]|uniref:DUF6984 domain-containing protein n=1 Tax=Dyadobacter jejuensis TaxID=1082580 RepID=A0A316ANV4_9BACT|nr:hypothetical protein [Dyadobacter jejuensis]PWJ59455.1 hypothetical protein CLV98_102288 [Dyadobacter jejuensis]